MQEKPTRMRWIIVASIFVTYFLMFIDRVNISVAAPRIMDEFAITPIQMGMTFSLFVAGYALFQVPGGWLGDRFGPRVTLTVAIVWWSAFTAFTAFAPDSAIGDVIGAVGALALVRFMIGVGEAAAPPNAARMITNWIPTRERGLAFGVAFSGNMLGAAVAPPLIVAIMAIWGWREVFYLAGLAGIAVALFWYLISTNTPAEHRWANEAEERMIREDQLEGKSEAASGWALFANREVWMITLAYTSVGYILYLYFSWFFIYLIEGKGMSEETASYYATLPFLVSSVCAPLGGKLNDWAVGRMGGARGRGAIGIVGLLIAAITIGGAPFVASQWLSVALLSIGAGSMYASMSSYWSASVAIEPRRAGAVSGFMNMGCNIGGAISPTLTPLIAATWSWSAALGCAAVVALLGVFAWMGALRAGRERERRLAAAPEEVIASA